MKIDDPDRPICDVVSSGLLVSFFRAQDKFKEKQVACQFADRAAGRPLFRENLLSDRTLGSHAPLWSASGTVSERGLFEDGVSSN
jgi:hypothetical protein